MSTSVFNIIDIFHAVITNCYGFTMNNITIKSLEAFQAIIETGSATAAAQKLNMTQPGISRLLSQFEQEVGFQLFYREKARLMPSEEALALVKEVELALSSVDRIGLLAKNIFSANWGELKVVAPNSFITGPLADAAADFMRQHPNVNLKLSSHSPARAREMVAHKAVDCGFIQMPETHPGLTCHPLLTSRTVCVVATSHPLAGLEQIHVSQLAGEPLILLGQGRYSRQLIDMTYTDSVDGYQNILNNFLLIPMEQMVSSLHVS